MSTANLASQEKTPPSTIGAIRNDRVPERQVEEAGESALDDDDEPPDGGYGWVVVIAIVFMNAATWGLSMLFHENPDHC
jgi:hypothetical protein